MTPDIVEMAGLALGFGLLFLGMPIPAYVMEFIRDGPFWARRVKKLTSGQFQWGHLSEAPLESVLGDVRSAGKAARSPPDSDESLTAILHTNAVHVCQGRLFYPLKDPKVTTFLRTRQT